MPAINLKDHGLKIGTFFMEESTKPEAQVQKHTPSLCNVGAKLKLYTKQKR
jgi:hypothetical protein